MLSRHNFRFWKNNKTLWTFFHCKAALDICTIWRRKKLSDETYARQLCVSSFYSCVWKSSNCTFGNPPVKNWFWCYEQSNLINTWCKVTVTPRSKKILKDIFCIVTCSFFLVFILRKIVQWQNSMKSNHSMKSNSMKSNHSMKSNSMKSNSMKCHSMKSNSMKNNSMKCNSMKSTGAEDSSMCQC